MKDSSSIPLTGTYPVTINKETKEISLKDGTYAFDLHQNEELIISSLPVGYQYSIKEEDTQGYAISSINPQSASNVQEDTSVTFVNKKKQVLYEAQIQAHKNYEDTLNDKQFRFLLIDENDQETEAFNDPEGNILFPTLYYSDIGEYTYTIKEDASYQYNDAISYDPSIKNVTVKAGHPDVLSLLKGSEAIMKDGDLLINDSVIHAFALNETTDGTYSFHRSPSIDERLHKLLYFQHTHPYDSTSVLFYHTEIPFTSGLMDQLVSRISQNNMNAYYETILNNILSQTDPVPDTFEIILFEKDDDRLIAGFEHSVSVDYEETPVFTNTKNTGELLIKKAVSPTDTDASFQFELKLLDASDEPVFTSSSTHQDKTLDWKEGVTTFSLKHNESLHLTSLPTPFSYEIKEINSEGYIVTYPEDPSSGNKVDQANVIINNQKAYSLKILKINEKKEPLEGVAFTLNDETGYTDKEGELIFYGLTEGTYTLKEVKTLKGYTLLKEPITIIIKEGKILIDGKEEENVKNSLILLTITNTKALSEIPNTGGSGEIFFFTLPLAGILMICIYMKKQQEKIQ